MGRDLVSRVVITDSTFLDDWAEFMRKQLIKVENVARSLDLTGLECPLPVLKTKKALSEMASGEVLHATTTDPMSVVDFRVFCERSGHVLHQIEESDGSDAEAYFEFLIERVDGAG